MNLNKLIMTTMIWLLFSPVVFAESLQVRIWSGWSPGGPTDQQVRTLQKHLQQRTDIKVVVEYKPGAAGTINLKHFAALEPTNYVELTVDGMTVLSTRDVMKMHNLDLHKDMQILLPVGHAQMLLLASNDSGIASIRDLQSKSSVTYASSGVGSMSHLATAYLQQYIGTDLVHVPYKGTAPVWPDLLEGRVNLFAVLASDTTALQHVKAGKVRAIAITGKRRHPTLPDVATLEELGLHKYPIDPWYAVFSHPKNNDGQTQLVRKALIDILSDPTVQRSYAENGVTVNTNALGNPELWIQNQIKISAKIAADPRFADLGN